MIRTTDENGKPIVKLTQAERQAVLAEQARRARERERYNWSRIARPNQLPPEGTWQYWLILAGRGFGKTRVGAETVRMWVKDFKIVNLIGATADDARDIMIEGESGILAKCPKDERPEYIASKRQLKWPNGAKSLIFTADEPERMRGKQHMKFWADELASWRYQEAWDQAMFGLRLGSNPQAVVTTTPKPIKIIKELTRDPSTHVTRGSTYDNRDNLSPQFFDRIITKYEGTRLGRQELNAEMLDDVPGALWQRSQIDEMRVRVAPDMVRIVVAIDPAVTSGEDSDETGIVVAGRGVDGHYYVLDDLTCRMSPDGWARRAVAAYEKHKADRIIAEVNNGGEMVERTIRTVDAKVPYKAVHASRGKVVRAEPIAALYEQSKVHHLGTFAALEDQLCAFAPGQYDGSPDRLDAMVWALSDLSETRMVEIPPLVSLTAESYWRENSGPKISVIM